MKVIRYVQIGEIRGDERNAARKLVALGKFARLGRLLRGKQMAYIATISVAGKTCTITQKDLSGLHRRARKAMNKLIAREMGRAIIAAPIYTDASGKMRQAAFYGDWGLSLRFETYQAGGPFMQKSAGYSITYKGK